MQKAWFRSRRRTKVRQRAKTRLKITHKNEIRKNFYKKHRFIITKMIVERCVFYNFI